MTRKISKCGVSPAVNDVHWLPYGFVISTASPDMSSPLGRALQRSIFQRRQGIWIRSLTTTQPSHSVFRELPPESASSLVTNGYAIVDNAVSKDTCASIREELDELARRPGALTVNETLFAVPGGDTRRVAKNNVREAELHAVSDDIRAAAPTLDGLRYDSSLPATLSCFEPTLTLGEVAVKAQVNLGDGGCFPIHVDSDPAIDRRVVTVLLYVNDGWDSAQDGGDLRLYPFPPSRRNDGEIVKYVDIAPVEGRAVLISANEMHHRVLPSHSKRYCVTLWLFGKVSRRVRKPAPLPADCQDLGKILCLPQYRKHVARVALTEEWETSLKQAHIGDQAEVALNAHTDDINKIRKAVARDIAAKFPSIQVGEVSSLLNSPEELCEAVTSNHSPAADGPIVQWLV